MIIIIMIIITLIILIELTILQASEAWQHEIVDWPTKIRRVSEWRGATPGLRLKIPVFSDPAPGKYYANTYEQIDF